MAVSAGRDHTSALKQDQTHPYGWADESHGWYPGKSGLPRHQQTFVAISSGTDHTCAHEAGRQHQSAGAPWNATFRGNNDRPGLFQTRSDGRTQRQNQGKIRNQHPIQSLPTVGPFPPVLPFGADRKVADGLREMDQGLEPWPPPAAQAHRKVTIQDVQTPGIRG